METYNVLRTLRSESSQGSLEAFQRLYELSSPQLLSYVKSLATPQEVEKVLESTYVEAWRLYQREVLSDAEVMPELERLAVASLRRLHP